MLNLRIKAYKNPMSFAFSLQLKTKGCAIDNQIVSGNIIKGHISESDHVEAFFDKKTLPIQVQSGGTFVIDISSIFLVNGVYTLKVQSLPHTLTCEAFLLVFEDKKIVVETLECEALLPFLHTQPPEIVGIVIGFSTDAKKCSSPCDCIKLLLDHLSLKKLGLVYGYAIDVLSGLGRRKICSCRDFDKDLICLGIKREWLEPLCCGLMNLLDFPKTKDLCIQAECPITIDFCEIVANHQDDFVYEIMNADLAGDACVKGHCLFYKPPHTSLFSIYTMEHIIYSATNAEGKTNEGTITIKIV